jgi:pimeloyl-ACP methyl ester carboxylesterase
VQQHCWTDGSDPSCAHDAVILIAIQFAATNATETTSWPPYSPTSAPIFQLSDDSQFAFYLEEMLSLVAGGGSSTGEILRIATQVVPHDFESFYTACYYMAEQVFAIAESVDAKKDPVSAREAYYRAATYYRGADFFLHGNQSDPRLISLWDQQLTAYNRANALLEIPGERFSLKTHSEEIGDYEAIGIFYAAYSDGRARPTILISGGYDSSQEEGYHQLCSQILSRGVNCVTYEGPGQPSVRRQQNIGFISDWWTVATPIVDYLSTRSDVDMSKLALAGISFGGALAPIAASHDDRYSAVIAIDGLFSLQQALEERFPPKITALFNSSNFTAFNKVMDDIQANSTYPTNLRWIIGYGLWAFDTLSPFDWFTRLGQISMNATLVPDIHMPVFIAKAQDDIDTEQEPEIAYEMLTTLRPNGQALTYYHEFNTSLGAGEHCSLGAEQQVWQVTMDWLSGVWGDWAYANN